MLLKSEADHNRKSGNLQDRHLMAAKPRYLRLTDWRFDLTAGGFLDDLTFGRSDNNTPARP